MLHCQLLACITHVVYLVLYFLIYRPKKHYTYFLVWGEGGESQWFVNHPGEYLGLL